MRKVYNTAIYKEVFNNLESDNSLAYAALPEDTFAQKIYKLRMKYGYTQHQFANICSVGYSSICKYETGYKPAKSNLLKICTALNISMSYFI